MDGAFDNCLIQIRNLQSIINWYNMDAAYFTATLFIRIFFQAKSRNKIKEQI